MNKITNNQLFCLIILFEIGSAIIFALGIDAKQNAWIAVVIALCFGFVLMWMYTVLQKKFPNKNLAEIIYVLTGKFIGIPIVILFALYFFHIASLILVASQGLISTTFLQETPLTVLNIIFLFTIIYTLWLGIDVLARIGEIIFPYIIFTLLSIFILLYFSNRININELTPILNEGILPVLQAAFKVSSFPFGETIAFLMILNKVDKKDGIRKTAFWALGISGIILISTTSLMISVLGVHYTSIASIPILKIIKLINIGNIITNLDSLSIIFLFITCFFKASLFFYGGVSCLSSIFNKVYIKWLSVVCGILLIVASRIFIPNYDTYLVVGTQITPLFIHPFFIFFMIPLLLIISFFKKRSSSEIN